MTTTLSLQVDSTLKNKADVIFSQMGISASTAVNLFLSSVVRHGSLPFDVQSDISNSKTLTAMDDVDNGRNLSKEFDSVDALMEELNA